MTLLSSERRLGVQLGAVMGLLMVPTLIILASVTLATVGELGDTARDSSRAVLTGQLTADLQEAATDSAATIETALRQYSRALKLVSYALSDALDSSSYPLADQGFYTDLASELPEMGYDSRYDDLVSARTGAFFWQGLEGADSEVPDSAVERLGNKSAHTDVFAQAIFEGFPAVQTVQICFSDNDAAPLRVVPGRLPLFDDDHRDHDCRNADAPVALALARDDDTVFSAPYTNADGVRLLAVSHAAAAGTAVVTIELRVDDLVAQLSQLSFLESGFAFIECVDSSVSECAEGTPLSEDAAAVDVDSVVLSAESQLTLFEDGDGVAWYVSSHEVSGAFSVLVFARVDEVLAPLAQMDAEIEATSASVTQDVMVVVVLVALLLPLFVAATVAVIVRPLGWVAAQAVRIANNCTEDNLIKDVSVEQSGWVRRLMRLTIRTEIHELADSFRTLIMDLSSSSASGKTAASAETKYVARTYKSAGLPWHGVAAAVVGPG